MVKIALFRDVQLKAKSKESLKQVTQYTFFQLRPIELYLWYQRFTLFLKTVVFECNFGSQHKYDVDEYGI